MGKAIKSRPPKKKHVTSLEATFMRVWDMVNKTDIIPQYQMRPCLPRQFRADVCFPAFRTSVELEGGVFLKDRNKGHASPKEFLASIEKNNYMVLRGLRILRYTAIDLRKRPVQVIEEILQLLASSKMWGPQQKPLPLGD